MVVFFVYKWYNVCEMFRLIKFIKGHRVAAVAAPLCKLIEAIGELIVPIIVASIIDVGIPNGDKSYVIKYCIAIAALAVGGFLISITGQFLASKVALGFGTKLRQATFEKINALPPSATDKMGGSSLITRLTGDVMNCQSAVNMTLRLVLRTPFVVIGAFVMSLIIDPILALLFLAMAVVLGCVITLVLRLTMPRIKSSQRHLDEISRQSAQALSGARVIRAFSKQETTKKHFGDAATDTAKVNMSAARIFSLLTPLTFAVVNLAIIAVLWFGGEKVNTGTLTQGEIVSLINYLNQAFFAIVAIGNVFSVFTRSAACAARVNEVLDMPLAPDGDAVDVDSACAETLRFDGVSFAYDGDYDVRDLSFVLQKDKMLGIIGGTGSGKSTVISLIERFYTPDKGTIYFCGKPLDEYSVNALRGCLGYVPQRAAIISGTLDSNLRIADPDVTEEREVEALRIAQASELLNSVGLGGKLNAGGKNLSGGQRQRVNIARALCRDNVLYLFDDVTSALDYKTERDFINEVKKLDGAKIFVSQRISAVSNCDEIIVLDGGQIVGRGKHDELRKSCPLYEEFCQSQQG